MNFCRLCHGHDLVEFLDLGFMPPADRFLRREQLSEPETHYPLAVMLCRTCGQVQLSKTVSPEILYRQDYPYESSITRTGRTHWAEFARSVSERMKLGGTDLVVDIGSNVGVLLSAFREQGTRILGVDPASNIVRIAERAGVETVNEFFNRATAEAIRREKGPATVVTATNVFAHIDDLDDFMAGIEALLAPRGALVLEVPYFVNLLRSLEYDTIYHEHLSYISVSPLIRFFARFGMEIHDVEQRDIHGGSIRIHVARKGVFAPKPAVEELARAEKRDGIHDPERLAEFAARVAGNRRDLTRLLHGLRNEGKRVAAVSAPAKGMTLLNYCRFGSETIEFVTEKSRLKIGRFTPGAHIPVLPDDELLSRMPDYALLLAWNFAAEIMENLSEYRARGGRFILPIPEPRIVA